ncbi:DUF1351 domain-containing protein [Leuconostoc gasicomitatum]|uniref:DUF1351 domain-containing protein n=1 Tax=Leuconostoc gasicomitatum TaxID=115778 RepID=UPI0015C96652|nr:DUF1351 domain-containing protein [Leuconostoc gasicomitatum]QLG77597.1 DUF1351 domain-containing protein [Leuconostoc gasicomitatum]
MNELTQPQIDVEKGQIVFKNVDQFKKDFEQIIQRNNNFIVTEKTLVGSRKSRAELRNAAKRSASIRSKIKEELLKPFDEVSQIAIAYEKQAKDAADVIDTDVKVFDEAEKQKRRDGLNRWLAERANELDINPDIEINEKWFIKGNFNGTVPKQSFIIDHLEPQFDLLLKAKEQRLADTIAVRNYAESKSFDPEGYIHNLDFKSLAQIMMDIDSDVTKRQKRQEAAQAVADMEAEQERQRHANETTVADKVIDTQTGEVVAEVPQDQPQAPMTSPQVVSDAEPVFTRLLYVTGTVEDMQAVATFLNANDIAFRGES